MQLLRAASSQQRHADAEALSSALSLPWGATRSCCEPTRPFSKRRHADAEPQSSLGGHKD